MRNKLILDKKKKTFVLSGVFYGYIERQTVYISNEKGRSNFKIKDVRIFNEYVDPNSRRFVRFFNVNMLNKETDCEEIGLFTFEENGFLPDIVFPSEYMRNKFYKFIKSYEQCDN